MLARPPPKGLAASPHDPRPIDPEAGARLLAGRFDLAGSTLDVGAGGDPWDRTSPSRRFALTLHRFDWMADLLSLGEPGAAEGLRLVLEWRRLFARWNGFSWAADPLERRVFNLACGLRPICAGASEAETATLALDLARQARRLLALIDGPVRAAERATAAALAGTVLGGEAGELLIARGLAQLVRALPGTVAADGGHASRSPRAALELLFDLQALDDALMQRGRAPPEAMLGAMDRLAGAVRFFTLADGALPEFQGGDAATRSYVAAARASEGSDAPPPAARNGYQRMDGKTLQVVADVAAPAPGPWSVTACAQPLAMEILAGRRRLIVNCAWSADGAGHQALRLIDGGSTACLADLPCGEPLRGLHAAALGSRLSGGPLEVEARRYEGEGALWLEMSHDGWAQRFGVRHERKLFLDLVGDELRGEDRFTPLGGKAKVTDIRKFAPYRIHFHVHPDVRASLARDGRSVLLKAEGTDAGWWLRNDAQEVAVEPSVYLQDGEPRRTTQIVLRGQARVEAATRVRWKLAQAEPAPH
jgi:uncharacterized heparinase superfamily protein